MEFNSSALGALNTIKIVARHQFVYIASKVEPARTNKPDDTDIRSWDGSDLSLFSLTFGQCHWPVKILTFVKVQNAPAVPSFLDASPIDKLPN